MAARRKNHEGKKYHHLTMIKPVRSGGAGKGMYWLAQCDCGTTREVRASEASLGYVKTCGKCSYHLALVQGAGAKGGHKFSQNHGKNRGLREQERRYIYSAMKRSIPWHLTPREFEQIVKQPCTYCQAEPREYKARLKKGKGRQVSALMNGIDRIDSSKGYTLDNCIACCTMCNRMKLDLPIADFIKQCTKISVLFGKYLEILRNKAEDDHERVDEFYYRLSDDLLKIHYGYRHTPIKLDASDRELHETQIALSQLLPTIKASLLDTGYVTDQDKEEVRSSQQLLDIINEMLLGHDLTPNPDMAVTMKVRQHDGHILKMASVQAKAYLQNKTEWKEKQRQPQDSGAAFIVEILKIAKDYLERQLK